MDTILMAADAIIGQAGRSGVSLILNGSRSKKALEWEWDKLPDYGALKHLTADQITRHTLQSLGQRTLPHPSRGKG